MMGKYVALTGRVLLASLFFFAALNKYHALVHASSYKDFVLLENAIAPRFAETKAALQRKYSEIYPRTNEREESVFVGFLEEVDDAKVLMIATLCELFGSVLLMFNFTLGSKLLMVFVVRFKARFLRKRIIRFCAVLKTRACVCVCA